jgi:uncharacterized protein YbbC (DUF1343 family)
MTARPAPARASILSGLDVLEREDFAPLAGKRVGLITNQTARDSGGRSAIDVLFASKRLRLVALFSPEHGIRGDAPGGGHVGDTIDPATGLKVYSLYGDTRRPTAAMLKDVDVLVFDIQDVGARFYTYLTTMAYGMEEAAKRHIEFVVLDRPNPINGDVVEGPVPDGPPEFTGYFPVPIRHGLTPGEMARLHAALKVPGLKLTVVPLQGWNRSMDYDETGYAWVDPSPNIRSLDAAFLYSALGLFEGSDISVGRGTDSPFLWFGAPSLDAAALAAHLNASGLAGARFHAEDRTPSEDLYKGKRCHGVRVEIVDRRTIRPMEIFIAAVCALRDRSAGGLAAAGPAQSLGRGPARSLFGEILGSLKSPAEIVADFAARRAAYEASRSQYLLY